MIVACALALIAKFVPICVVVANALADLARVIVVAVVELTLNLTPLPKASVEVAAGLSQKQAENLALKSEKIKNIVGKNKVAKIIFVPNKLINIVV